MYQLRFWAEEVEETRPGVQRKGTSAERFLSSAIAGRVHAEFEWEPVPETDPRPSSKTSVGEDDMTVHFLTPRKGRKGGSFKGLSHSVVA